MQSLPHIQVALLILALTYTLSLARTFFIPLTLAFLLSLVLSPLVLWLERLLVKRAISAGVLVLALVSGLGYGLSVSLDSIEQWVQRAPRVLNQLEHKIYPIKKTVEEVNKTAEQVDRITSVGKPASERIRTVKDEGISFRDVVYANAQGLVVNFLMVTFLLYFLLSWGQIMLVRSASLIGDKRQRSRFLSLSSILEYEVSKYLLTITLINATLGLAVAAALYALGMPNPLLWGAVAGLLNFIPYLGSVLTAILIAGAALLSFDGLIKPAIVVGVFEALTILEGQVITPLIVGRNLALNPLVVFLSVVFWFWLWGVMGALMAVPILITLKILGDNVDALKPVSQFAGR